MHNRRGAASLLYLTFAHTYTHTPINIYVCCICIVESLLEAHSLAPMKFRQLKAMEAFRNVSICVYVCVCVLMSKCPHLVNSHQGKLLIVCVFESFVGIRRVRFTLLVNLIKILSTKRCGYST